MCNYVRAGKSFSLTDTLYRVSLPNFGWHTARRGGPIKRRASRCVRVAAHVKSCARWESFFVTGEIWPGFPSPVSVGVDNLGTTVCSIEWLSVPWTTSWGGCCGRFLGTRRAFLAGGLPSGKQGQGRVNPGETCVPAYSEALVLRKTSVVLGPRVSGARRVVSRAGEGT